jgi:mono/diheme cytochrome c family protein
VERAVIALLAALLAAAPIGASADGKSSYQQHCAMCHQPDGSGVTGIYPRLKGRVAELAATEGGGEYLTSVIAFGMIGPVEVDGVPIVGFMPGVSSLTSAEIEELLRYLVSEIDGGTASAGALSETAIDSVLARKLSPSAVHRMRQDVLDRMESASVLEVPPALRERRISGEREDYARECQGCHRADGLTDERVVPPLRNFAGYFTHTAEGREYLIRVPGVAQAALDDARLASLVNWLLETYSRDELVPGFVPYTAEEVGPLRAQMLLEVSGAREERIAELRREGVLH